MKKIYNFFRNFLINHYKISFIILVIMETVLGGIMLTSYENKIAIITWSFTTIAFIEFLTYKIGPIPLFSRDRTYESIKRECKGDEELAEKQYKRTKLLISTVCFPIAIILFPIAILVEVLIEVGVF